MSVASGGGSPSKDRTAEALQGAGRHVFAYLYESYAALLFDYCAGVLGDEVAAVIAVQDSLVAVDAQIAKLPDADRLRVSLYSEAHRQCQGQLAGRRGQPSHSSGTTTPAEVAPEEAGPAAAGRDARPVVTAALARLADRDREVLNLAFRHGAEGADLAAVLGVSPRRARAMLSDADARFRKSAAVVAVLRGDLAGCEVAETIAGKRDPASPRPTPERRELLIRHLESCPACTGKREGHVFGPEMLAAVPLATPPLTLRLRITRTALALGSYRRGGAGRTRDSVALSRSRAWGGRGLPHAMVVSSLGLVILAVPGTLLYRLASTPAAGRNAVAARIASGIQSPAASSSLISPALDPRGSVRQRKLPPLPGLGPTPLGVLPVPPPHHGGRPPTSAPSPHTTSPRPSPPHTTPPTKPPTTPPPTPPPTTPPPTTPPPTTPPPTTPPPTTPPPTTPPPTA